MTIETKVNRFEEGITNNLRDSRRNVARVISNFDIFTKVGKMTPHRSSESGDSAPTTSVKRNFAVARRTGTAYSLYSLGKQSAVERAEVLYKDLAAGTNGLDDNTWATPSANQSAAGLPSYNLFVFYRKAGLIYMSVANSRLEAFSPTGTAWNNLARSLTHTEIGQGLVHSKDDILYIPYYDNAAPTSAILKYDGTTWTDAALTLPQHYIPTSICEYGNLLAIGCSVAGGIGNSRVFLWNRDSTLATLDESIDWGSGSLLILEEVDGELIGISQQGGAAAAAGFTGLPQISVGNGDKIIFRKLLGNRAVKLFELQANHSGGANTTILPIYKQKVDNRLFFQMIIELNGAIRDGIWSVGRSSPEAPFSLVHERTSNNDTALVNGDNLRGFIVVGGYIFQSYLSGTTHATNKTNDRNDGNPYNHYSVYESKRFDGRDSNNPAVDSSYYKDLVEATVNTEFLPVAASVELSYRTDQNTAWTVIFTNTTDNSIFHTAVNIESTGAPLPKDYREIEFRIRVTGGANTGAATGGEITGFSFKEAIKGRRYIATS